MSRSSAVNCSAVLLLLLPPVLLLLLLLRLLWIGQAIKLHVHSRSRSSTAHTPQHRSARVAQLHLHVLKLLSITRYLVRLPGPFQESALPQDCYAHL